ncbi:thiamine biosynthesis protein ThiS [Candidatus Woesearchaeota archaeon]|nr:thiamine biosynthesis protein ThiS [Candidatus Woesearchaeota archaeon]
MDVVFESGERKTLKFTGTVKSLFVKLDLNLEEFLVSRLGEILTSDSKLQDCDVILLINVVSGG